MAKSKQALLTFVLMIPGMVINMASWQVGFATMYELLLRHLSGPVAALGLRPVMGIPLAVSYLTALKASTGFPWV